VWMDVLFIACAKLNMKEADIWELDWLGGGGYEYLVWHYNLESARQAEPMRDLQTQLYNMFAEEGKGKTPAEFYWLLTDRFKPRTNKQNELAEQKAHWAEMKAAGLV
jgi:hypothetical protein